MTSPRVFAVSNPTIMTKRGPAPKYDLEPAKAWGQLILVYDREPENPFAYPERTLLKIDNALRGRYEHEKDYLLMVGNPTLAAWMMAVVVRWGFDRVTTLQWVRSREQYVPVTLQLK